jgi:hypothetical protein
VLLVIVLSALLAGLHYAKNLVNRFTATEPMELPAVHMSQAEIDKLKQRCEAFQQAVHDHRATAPLVLSADDINALIDSVPEVQALKGKLYVGLESNQLQAQLSWPLPALGLTMFKGRYLNGSGTFDLSFRDGVLSIRPQAIQVKGKPVPEVYMQGIRGQNLAAGLTNQPNTAAVLKGLQEIQVTEGKLVMVPKEKE